MKQILTLLSSDYWELRRWFQHERFSKLLVGLGFIFIIALVSTALYGGTSIFFRGLARYEHYGLLSANYLFHAGLIILLGLIIVLSTVSFCTFLYSSTRKMNSLFVLPLPSYVIPGWLFLREMMISFLFFLFFLTPFLMSFYRYFVRTDSLPYIATFISVVLILSAVTPILGIGLGLLVCMGFQKYKKATILVGILLFLFGGYILSQLIFPPQLKTLYNASTEQFEATYTSLPLSSPYLPTTWLIKGITEGNIFYILPFLSATGILCLIVGVFASHNFTRMYKMLFDRPYRKTSVQKFDQRFLTTKWPLVYKDVLSITRVTQEGGYAVFLIALTFVFFLFLLFARQFRSETYEGGSMLLLFYFIACMFYTIAYTLRMIFPLMAKEGRATWHIFTMPITRAQLLQHKVYTAFVIILPFIAGSFALWMIAASSFLIGVFALLVIISLVITAVSLGSIHPNFSESENAEKISTSAMGMLALFIMLSIIAAGSYSLYMYSTYQSSLWLLFPAVCFLAGSWVLFLWAKKEVAHYQF